MMFCFNILVGYILLNSDGAMNSGG